MTHNYDNYLISVPTIAVGGSRDVVEGCLIFDLYFFGAKTRSGPLVTFKCLWLLTLCAPAAPRLAPKFIFLLWVLQSLPAVKVYPILKQKAILLVLYFLIQ